VGLGLSILAGEFRPLFQYSSQPNRLNQSTGLYKKNIITIKIESWRSRLRLKVGQSLASFFDHKKWSSIIEKKVRAGKPIFIQILFSKKRKIFFLPHRAHHLFYVPGEWNRVPGSVEATPGYCGENFLSKNKSTPHSTPNYFLNFEWHRTVRHRIGGTELSVPGSY
jgi:hypothetical protein